ncbi:MAG: glycosyltransferase family 4 protein [Treponema sp.]|nr:glycosyltransferase family 4 protein [Treponema sp.]
MPGFFKFAYSIFEKCFGFIYHPIVRFYRFNEYTLSDFFSFFVNYFFLYKCKESKERKIYLDVTYLSKCQRFAGICRVVSKIEELLGKIQDKYEIVPVIGKQYLGFYERDSKKIIKPGKGDIFFSAEVTQGIFDTNRLFFDKIQKKDCKLVFFLHDLIPVLFPEYNGSMKFFRYYQKYLKILCKSDLVICNSKSVLDDFEKYIVENKIKTNPCLKKNFTHLGVDFQPSLKNVEKSSADTINFLMVSTVEVRKKYDQAVEAFELLWKKNYDISLSIVGKYGWRAEKARELIENSAEYGKRLKWYNTGISDSELASLYNSCDALIFASKTEGFGLALIEAAIYKKPLIIRDIPIFREVASDKAFYFSGDDGESLASAIEKWIELYKQNKYPHSEGIKYISWEESVKNMYKFIETI